MLCQYLTIVYSPYSIAQKFILEGLNREGVICILLDIKKNKCNKILYYLFLKLHIYNIACFFRFSRKFRKIIKETSSNILFFDCCKLDEYIALHTLVNNQKNIIFFWNPLESLKKTTHYVKSKLMILNKLGYNLTTFDSADAQKYGIEWIRNVDRKIQIKDLDQIIYDFYFIGMPKGREYIINNLKNKLEQKGFKLNFILIKSREDVISPFDNIVNSAHSRCIVDIVSPKYHQVGLTLRPFDAMFLKKKIITTSFNITQYDFFNSNNIYVIKDDKLTGIEDFMNKPYVNLSNEIINSYEINNWVEQFMDLNND